jgi:hypothetical protein
MFKDHTPSPLENAGKLSESYLVGLTVGSLAARDNGYSEAGGVDKAEK